MSNFCKKCGCHFATHNDDGSCVADSVELIASGYEWTCPSCEHFNREIQVTEEVYCQGCQREFIVEDYNHAVR